MSILEARGYVPTNTGQSRGQMLRDMRASLSLSQEELQAKQLQDQHMQEVLKRIEFDEYTGAMLFKSSFQPVILSKMLYDSLLKQIDKLSDECQKSKDKVEELSSIADDWKRKYFSSLQSNLHSDISNDNLRQGGGRPVLFTDAMQAMAIVEFTKGKSYSEISNILSQEVKKLTGDESKEISVSTIQKFLRKGNRHEVNSFLLKVNSIAYNNTGGAQDNAIAFMLRGIKCVPDGCGGFDIKYTSKVQ